jgi:hypothetical protein
VGLPVMEADVDLHRRTEWWKKVWALFATSTMAAITGVIAATLIGFGASWMVITLSHMLKK